MWDSQMETRIPNWLYKQNRDSLCYTMREEKYCPFAGDALYRASNCLFHRGELLQSGSIHHCPPKFIPLSIHTGKYSSRPKLLVIGCRYSDRIQNYRPSSTMYTVCSRSVLTLTCGLELQWETFMTCADSRRGQFHDDEVKTWSKVSLTRALVVKLNICNQACLWVMTLEQTWVCADRLAYTRNMSPITFRSICLSSRMSAESQKGIITIQRWSVENQIGAISVQSLLR